MKPFSGKFLLLGSAMLLLAGGPKLNSVSPKQPGIALGGRAVVIAAHPNNANNIIVASDSGGLFRSTNHGATWTQVSGSTTFWFSDVTYLPSNGDIVLATAYRDSRVVSGGGIWRSTDGGTSWAQVTVNPPTSDCATDFAAYALAAETGRNRFWAGTLCGLAYSDDSGAAWTFLPAVTGYAQEKVFAVLAPSAGRLVIRTYGGLKISTDGGSTWVHSTSGLPTPYSRFGAHNDIAAAPQNPDHLYWAFNYSNNGEHIALYRSLDNGASWSSIFDYAGANRPPFVRTAKALSGDSTQYDIYFGNGGCSLQRATAYGDSAIIPTWTPLSADHCDAADVGFSTDHKTPILLASDGGLHNTANNGLNWSLVGGGKAGYNALQIYEVTGQLHNDGLSSDLYFGTQDNSIWASPDEGGTWPANFSSEGYYLDIPRDFYPLGITKLSGVYCLPCFNFIADPQFLGVSNFADAPNQVAAPKLLTQPGEYIQQTETQGLDDSFFDLTTNTGINWTPRFSFPEPVWGRPEVANDNVVYMPVHEPGTTSTGAPLVELKRVSGVLGNNTPLISNVSGFGSLGFHGFLLAGRGSFGVDPKDSNFLMVSDIVDNQVKVSTDAGATWTADTALTDLVTESGQLVFSQWPNFTQTTAIAFDPTCDGHIVIGTLQAGVFETFDRGGSWQKLGNSELIPNVSSIFFPGNGRLVISSFGRGLWKYSYTCPAKPIHLDKLAQFAEPLIYWKGARIPISQIHDPDTCPACGYFLLLGGKVLDYKTSPGTNELVEVIINKGEFKGYTWQGASLPVPFKVTTKKGQQAGGAGALGSDKQLQALLGVDQPLQDAQAGKSQIKGLFLEERTLRGLILATDDLSFDQLPKKVTLGPHIKIDQDEPVGIDELEPVLVKGIGFDPRFPLEVLLDGQIVQPEFPPDFDPQGNFTLSVQPPPSLGLHTILVRQDTELGLIQDIATFGVTLREAE